MIPFTYSGIPQYLRPPYKKSCLFNLCVSTAKMNFPPALCLVGSSLSLQENCVQIFLLTSVGNACKHGDHCCCQVTSVMSDSVWPHRQQPTRLPHPWDSQGKNTGVGCHFLLQCMKVKSESEVTQSCLTLSDPMDCSPPGSSIHGIFWARVLEWGANGDH